MPLTDEQLAEVEAAITGPDGPELMKLMECITSYGKLGDDFSEDVVALARTLGWMTAHAYPTDLGWEVGDPIREFLLWNRRDRNAHHWLQLPVMQPEYFEDKDLLSVGCGCGTNLLALQSLCKSVTGIEVVETYLQFTPIWARLAQMETPKTILGAAEDMPFENDRFDIVVCFGALQYMKLYEVLREISRVVEPGGLVVLTLSDLGRFVLNLGRRLLSRGDTIRRPRELAHEIITVGTTLTYPWTGRLVNRKSDPVYPTVRRMERWLQEVGLEPDRELTRPFGHEMCYVARRR